MIYRLSEEELKKARTIEESYDRLIKECEDRIAELRSDGYDDRGLPNVEPKDFEKWLAAGSDEWREERKKRLGLVQECDETINAYFESVYDAHFKKIAGDPEAIEKDAIDEIDDYIPRIYKYYSNEFKVNFSSSRIRATEDGFLLDTDETVKALTNLLTQRHFKALEKDKKRIARINEYLVKVVDESALTSSEVGELGGRVMKIPKPVKHETTEREYVVIRPAKYMTTVDKVSQLTFLNELTAKPREENNDEKGALWDVPLQPRESETKIIARVAINYDELIKSGALQDAPELISDDYNVHDALLSLRNAGNYALTKTMIYRAMTGKVKGSIEVPKDANDIIEDALTKFKGLLELEYSKQDKNGNVHTIRLKEPIVTYMRGEGLINGKHVDDLIILPRDDRFMPPLQKWALFNGNEIDTRDITLLDVPRLNNGKESRDIKMCLYRRLISMRNIFERKKGGKYELAEKQRTIRYDYIYNIIGVSDPDKNKRRLLKDKIDRCMSYWKKKGFIADYEHKRDKNNGNQYYAVMVSFVLKE